MKVMLLALGFLVLVVGMSVVSSSFESWFDRGLSLGATGYVSQEGCSDSDGGVNLSSAGTTTGKDVYGGNGSASATYADRCVNASAVLEFSCSAEGVAGANVSCPEGCTGGVCRGANTSVLSSVFANASEGNLSSSNASGTDQAFPDPLSPESQDFFEEFRLEDFLTPEGVANAQPELSLQPETAIEEVPVRETIESVHNVTFDEELDPPLNKVLLNLTVNTTSNPPRLIGRATYVDKSLLFPQFLPNVRPDAGLFATCELAYQNASLLGNFSFPRGSSTVLYISALSPSLKCPRSKHLDMEIAYRLVNTGIAEIFPGSGVRACRAPWYSSATGAEGVSIVRTPFAVHRVIVKPGGANKVVRGSFVVPIREGSATNFNHFNYNSPRAVYLEAFRGTGGDYVSMEFTLVRCVEGTGAGLAVNASAPFRGEDVPEPAFMKKAWCKIASWFGRDYESCLYE